MSDLGDRLRILAVDVDGRIDLYAGENDALAKDNTALEDERNVLVLEIEDLEEQLKRENLR